MSEWAVGTLEKPLVAPRESPPRADVLDFRTDVRRRFHEAKEGIAAKRPAEPLVRDLSKEQIGDLGFSDSLVNILSGIKVRVVARERTKHFPKFANHDPELEEDTIVEGVQKRLFGESYKPASAMEERFMREDIMRIISYPYNFSVQWRTMMDRFGSNHYGEGGRVAFRNSLRPKNVKGMTNEELMSEDAASKFEDIEAFEKTYNDILQNRKHAFSAYVNTYTEGIPNPNDLSPTIRQRLLDQANKIGFLYTGDEGDFDVEDRVPSFSSMTDDEKIAAVRVAVDLSQEMLEYLLPPSEYEYEDVPVT